MSVADVTARVRRPRRPDALVGVPFGPIAILLALVVLFTVAQPRFFTLASFQTIASNAAIVLVFAVGQTLVIITGRIDLSIGGMASLATVLLPKWIPSLGVWAILAVVLVFAAAGVLQAYVHMALRLPSFVVTIAGLFVWNGLALAISKGNEVVVPRGTSDPTTWLSGNEFVGSIPAAAVVALVVLVIVAAAMRWLPLGRRVYAIGVSERAAIVAGLPVRRTVLVVFGISGACAGLAGAMLIANFRGGNAGFADSQLLPVITAVVIGGTAITGGHGGLFRTLIGASILSVLLVGMTIAGWRSEWQQVIYGVILILAVLVTTNRKKSAVIK